MQPRDLLPQHLGKHLSSTCPPAQCSRCSSKQQAPVPTPRDIPRPLRRLTGEIIDALRLVDADFGPVIRSRNAAGQPNGYRQHASMVRFSWKSTSVQFRIDHLRSREDRDDAERALDWLLRHTGDDSEKTRYGFFYEEHRNFLRTHPRPDEGECKRWLRFIERVGVESAYWPHLFPKTAWCLTYVRSLSRQPMEDTVERRMGLRQDLDTLDVADEPDFNLSTKKAYQALVMSGVLDFAASYEFTHFAFDLNLWTCLGSKRNLGLAVPMRLMMRGHSFSPDYWKDFHRVVIDLVRQRGYPQIFETNSPLEWSQPYHCLIVDCMAKTRKGRQRLPTLEALAQVHILYQLSKNFVGGSNNPTFREQHDWKHQLLPGVSRSQGIPRPLSIHRIEFQDGTRREATQCYHGTGRPHEHNLRWAHDVKALKLELALCASVDGVPQPLRGYVLSSQTDRGGKSPWILNHLPSFFEEDSGKLVLHHTEQDARLGLRAYYPQRMLVEKSHEDVQFCHGDENYTSYVTKYVPKMSDSMSVELLNDDADADALASTILFRYKPMEPEMVLQLFGSRFRQWQVTTDSGGRRHLRIPLPDTADMPDEVRRYEQCSWRSEEMTFLDWLRKTNDDGHIAHWLRQLAPQRCSTSELHAFASDYKPAGEKAVACEVLSRLNDKWCGQWLMMNVPFRDSKVFHTGNKLDLIPPAHKYMAMCLICEHPKAVRVWGRGRLNIHLLGQEMKEEAINSKKKQSLIRHLLATAHLVTEYLDGRKHKDKLPACVLQEHEAAVRRKVWKLPIKQHYEDLLLRDKIWEGRCNTGSAAAVCRDDILQLGSTRCLVSEVAIYPNFRDFLNDVGVENCLPSSEANSVAEGVAVYHAFHGYAEKAALHGVRAFRLAPVPAESESRNNENHDFNVQQLKFLADGKEAVDMALAVLQASTEAQADSAREKTRRQNQKIIVVEGPPGSGKTTVMHALVKYALDKEGDVLFTGLTAELVSRNRLKFGGQVTCDTCHAAFAFGEEIHLAAQLIERFALAVVDEFSLLEGHHFEHIARMRKLNEYVTAFALAGDQFQLSGFGEERVWHTPLWKKITFSTTLVDMFRCKDPGFARILKALRTSEPRETQSKGGITMKEIMHGRRAWKGHEPSLEDARRILISHPETEFLAISRAGSALLNSLATQSKFPRRQPLAIVPGDVESNPDNYHKGKLKPLDQLTPFEFAIYESMKVYLTKNRNKDSDHVNGMLAFVESYDSQTQSVGVVTVTGHRLAVYLYTDEDLGNLVYHDIRPGYASTVMKKQGAELKHVTIWLDACVRGAAYTALSRVSYGRDVLIGGFPSTKHFQPVV